MFSAVLWSAQPPWPDLPPVPQNVLKSIVGSLDEYSTFWRNRAGSAAYLQDSGRFYFQTPQDSDSFCSFSSVQIDWEGTFFSYRGLLIVPDFDAVDLFLTRITESFDYHGYRNSARAVKGSPLRFLKHRVERTIGDLTKLVIRVRDIEETLIFKSLGIRSTVIGQYIAEIHKCNMDLINIESRWEFETILASNVLKYIDKEHGSLDRDKRPMMSDWKRANVSKVYQLMAQRDTKATTELASHAAMVAEATMRDSVAMKTIAAVTLIFLPPTFLCIKIYHPVMSMKPQLTSEI
ncbi:hypothetical protein SUNI508_01578 [Seiridium unicorne]|uniref:Uncharacterized protein n=1 Tax=Seiridium unicorne TaxID=138068 RepID=A0ABR2UU63_9PEZI